MSPYVTDHDLDRVPARVETVNGRGLDPVPGFASPDPGARDGQRGVAAARGCRFVRLVEDHVVTREARLTLASQGVGEAGPHRELVAPRHPVARHVDSLHSEPAGGAAARDRLDVVSARIAGERVALGLQPERLGPGRRERAG